MIRPIKIALAFASVVPLAAGSYFLASNSNSGLETVHYRIERQFPQVKHVDGDRLSVMRDDHIVFFDVREKAEFKVSHLKNAIRVDPDISVEKFIARFGEMSKGKVAIFYCSVGQRSSDLANRVQSVLISSGVKAVYNLEGGAFRWHNQRRPLYTGTQPTQLVHGYNRFWGRMVNNQQFTQY